MKKIKNLQIKRPLSLLLAAGILACARPVAVCNRAQALTKGNVELGKTFFASNTELGSTWGDVSVDITSGDVSTSGGTGQKLWFGYATDEGWSPLMWNICSRLNVPTDALKAQNIAANPATTNALVLLWDRNKSTLDMPFSDSASNDWNTSNIKKILASPTLQSKFFYKGELNLISDSVVKVLPYGSNMQTNIDAAKFFLPCGALPLLEARTGQPNYNIKETGFISWGEDDAVEACKGTNPPMKNDFPLVANKYEKTIIPMKYWPYLSKFWLRSAFPGNDQDVLVSGLEVGVTSNSADKENISVAPLYKIDLASVEFASAAFSAAILDMIIDKIENKDELFTILDAKKPETPPDGENPGEPETPPDGENPGEPETPPDGENPGEPEIPPEGENPGEPEIPPEGENPGDMRKPKPKEKRLLTKSHKSSTLFLEVPETGLFLRLGSGDVHQPTVATDTITGTAGETVTIQGFTNGVNWSYSKKISKDASGAKSQVTLEDVNKAGIEAEAFSDQNKLTSFEKVTVWGEKMGTGDQEGLLLTSATPKDNTPEPPTPGNPNPNEPGNGGNKPNAPGNGVTSPPTGDNLQTWLWLGGAAITGFASWYVSMRKRSRRA